MDPDSLLSKKDSHNKIHYFSFLKISIRRRRGRQRMRGLDGITNSMGMCLGKLPEFVM